MDLTGKTTVCSVVILKFNSYTWAVQRKVFIEKTERERKEKSLIETGLTPTYDTNNLMEYASLFHACSKSSHKY